MLLLVLHQRNQRRHDHHRMLQKDRWQLVRKRLAAARRQDAKHILFRKDGLHNLTLPGTEALDAESLASLCRNPLPGHSLRRLLAGGSLHFALAGALYRGCFQYSACHRSMDAANPEPLAHSCAVPEASYDRIEEPQQHIEHRNTDEGR